MLTGPTKFGPYELLERIGMGGMAEVFLARQRGEEGFERLVAIKRILPHVSEDPEFVRMFIDEAKIAVQLSHPHVAQIYDLGREGEVYFIAQEYVHGRDMGAISERQASARVPLPIPLVLFIAMRVCEALAHAHEATAPGGQPLGLIHRDVSPSNILVSFEGGVKVIDFGLAKAAGRLVTTQAGVVKGKLAYLSSEQARGHSIDSRSDLFSLGTCLFEWLTGERLFARRNDMETVVAVQQAAVPPLRAIRADIPPALQSIVLRALQPDPNHRFQTAQEMHDALLTFVYEHRLVMKRRTVGEYARSLFPEAILDEPLPMEAVGHDTSRPHAERAMVPEVDEWMEQELVSEDDSSPAFVVAPDEVDSRPAPANWGADALGWPASEYDEGGWTSGAWEPASMPLHDAAPDDDSFEGTTTATGDRARAILRPSAPRDDVARIEEARFEDVRFEDLGVEDPGVEYPHVDPVRFEQARFEHVPFEDATPPTREEAPPTERPAPPEASGVNAPARVVSFEDTTFPERDEGLAFDDTTSPYAGQRLDELLAAAVATTPGDRVARHERAEAEADPLDAVTSAGTYAFDDDFDDVTKVNVDPLDPDETSPGSGRGREDR